MPRITSHPETTFYARVSGDSMHDAGLFDGDIIVIDKSLEPTTPTPSPPNLKKTIKWNRKYSHN